MRPLSSTDSDTLVPYTRLVSSAAPGERVSVVGDHAVDLAGTDQLKQLAELRADRAPVAVARRRRWLDQLDDDVDLQPPRGLPARRDLHVEGRGPVACDRLACIQSRSVSRCHR